MVIKFAALAVLINVFVSTQICAQRTGCAISFPRRDDRTQPLILKKNANSKYDLIIPQQGIMQLRSGESASLFCPNTRNELEQSKRNLTAVTCINGENLKVDNKHYQFNDLQCKLPIKGSIQETNIKCGNGKGITFNIGYNITRDDWYTLIKVCYDNNEANALYTEHIIYGQTIKYASRQSYRPAFQSNGIAPNISANNLFKQIVQKETLTKLLGATTSRKYIRKNSYLARGHLSPDADFLFPGLQYATYFYINTCPQWESVNAGNWLAIESAVRRSAEKYQAPLRVITGSHGVLSLPDVNNNLQDIHLAAGGKLPVPKFLWKVVYSERTGQAIAFVALNNPFAKIITEEDKLCPDICKISGWYSSRWNNLQKGFVYCCDVRILAKQISTIPKLQVSGILK